LIFGIIDYRFRRRTFRTFL